MADRRTEVIVEILNSLVYHLEAEDSYNTELMKSAIVEDSENTVKRRVARLKQIKDNKRKVGTSSDLRPSPVGAELVPLLL